MKCLMVRNAYYINKGGNTRNKKSGRSLNFPWQAPEVLTKDGAYTIQEERDVRNAMQLCSESFDL